MNRNAAIIVTVAACLLVGAALMAGGCTEQQRAKNWGGEATVELEAGRKLVVVTWKGDEIWFLTRDMREGDRVETYEFAENSSWGIMEGKVIIKEAAPTRPPVAGVSIR